MDPLRRASNLSPAIRQAPQSYLFTTYSIPKPLNRPHHTRTRQLVHVAFYSTKNNKPDKDPKQQPDQESLFDRLYLQWQKSVSRRKLDELRIRKDENSTRDMEMERLRSNDSVSGFFNEDAGFLNFIFDLFWFPTLAYMGWKNMANEEELRRRMDRKAGKDGGRGGVGETEGGSILRCGRWQSHQAIPV
jgi:hypothetical protein